MASPSRNHMSEGIGCPAYGKQICIKGDNSDCHVWSLTSHRIANQIQLIPLQDWTYDPVGYVKIWPLSTLHSNARRRWRYWNKFLAWLLKMPCLLGCLTYDIKLNFKVFRRWVFKVHPAPVDSPVLEVKGLKSTWTRWMSWGVTSFFTSVMMSAGLFFRSWKTARFPNGTGADQCFPLILSFRLSKLKRN